MNTVRYDYQKPHFLKGGHCELTGLLCQFVETQADTMLLTTHLQTDWPK